MNKYLPLAAIAALFLISSCTKSLQDRLTGSWRLEGAYRKVFPGRDYFTTGYEDGVFTFSEDGSASYAGYYDTLHGYWQADNYTNNYFNSNTGQWETRSMRYLRLYLANFPGNKFLTWNFDDFTFRNGHRTVRAEQYSGSNDRVYEFVRQ